jgi:hypothetical protein
VRFGSLIRSKGLRPCFEYELDLSHVSCFRFFVRLTPALLELDGLVVNVELTLASIIQGVALYFLTENARGSFALHQSITWLYVASGLLILLVFWSRSIIHTFTLIRWPLEFGHNFLYIGCALVEALMFTRVTDPLGWFEISVVYALGIWVLFAYDLRMVRPRPGEEPSTATRQLSAMIERDQRLNIWILIPALFLYGALSVVCLRLWPHTFITRQAHAWLAVGQFLALLAYLYYVVRLFARFAPLVTQRQEERKALVEKRASTTHQV